ncbi:MAG: PilZ domain-containing protein [Desulfobacterales bacterium]
MKTVYANVTRQTTITCPNCGFEKNIDATNLKNTRKKLKVKCQCGEIFRLIFEFRKHDRKIVRLTGEYLVRGKNEKGEIIVEDISASGIRFASLNPHFISRDDAVELSFTLDDPSRTKIHTHVKIVWIIDQSVGAQFIDPESLEKDLGAYLKT